MTHEYNDIKFSIHGGIGTITFNRPRALNSFGGMLIPETIAALRVLNEHPDTVFTVITGEGRFFSAGADVTGIAAPDEGVSFASD
jgi:peroxisomal 3,2-trans-enoyl-CoA isomerase